MEGCTTSGAIALAAGGAYRVLHRNGQLEYADQYFRVNERAACAAAVHSDVGHPLSEPAPHAYGDLDAVCNGRRVCASGIAGGAEAFSRIGASSEGSDG